MAPREAALEGLSPSKPSPCARSVDASSHAISASEGPAAVDRDTVGTGPEVDSIASTAVRRLATRFEVPARSLVRADDGPVCVEEGLDPIRRATSGVYLLALGIGLSGHSGVAVVAALASYAAAQLLIARQQRHGHTLRQYRVLADRACRRGRFEVARDYYQRAQRLAQSSAGGGGRSQDDTVDRYQIAAVDAMLGNYVQAGGVLESIFCSPRSCDDALPQKATDGIPSSRPAENSEADGDDPRAAAQRYETARTSRTSTGELDSRYSHASWLLRYVAYHLARRGERARAHRLSFAALAIVDHDEPWELKASEYAWLALTVGEYEAAADMFARLLDDEHDSDAASLQPSVGPSAPSRFGRQRPASESPTFQCSAKESGATGEAAPHRPHLAEESAPWSPYRVRSAHSPKAWRSHENGALGANAPELGLAIALRRLGDTARAKVMLEELRASCAGSSAEVRGTVLRELGEAELAHGDRQLACGLLAAAAAADLHADRRTGGLALDHVALARAALKAADLDAVSEALAEAYSALSGDTCAAAAAVEQLAAFLALCLRDAGQALAHCDAALEHAAATCGVDHRDHVLTWALRAWAQQDGGLLIACDESLRAATRILAGGKHVDALAKGTLALVRAQRLTWRAATHGSAYLGRSTVGATSATAPRRETMATERGGIETQSPVIGIAPPTATTVESLIQARAAARQALALWERELGPAHPALHAPLAVLMTIASACGQDVEQRDLEIRYSALLTAPDVL